MIFGAKTSWMGILVVASFCCVLSAPAFGEGDGSDVLFGLAATVSAASPAVMAGIQASADKDIAKTNAASSVAQAQIQADASKFQADLNAQTSLMQSQTAQIINAQNNQGQTERLGMMLAEQAAAREQENALKNDEMRNKYALQRQELQMADIEREENYKLAMYKLEAQKVAAGISTGFTPVNSGLVTTPPAGVPVNSPYRAKSVGSQVALAAFRSSPPLGNPTRTGIRAKNVQTNYGFIAQGSTRALRQKGVSDLSAFQSSLMPPAPRGIASSDEGLRRHQMPDGYQRNLDQPSHR